MNEIPRIGDRIIMYGSPNRIGTVRILWDRNFTYMTDDGVVGHACYTTNWDLYSKEDQEDEENA